MSMLKKIKSLFVIDEGQNNNASEQNNMDSEVSVEPAKSTGGTAEPSTPASTSGGNVSQKFLEVLATAMEQNNLPGFDYMEYKQSLRSLEKMNMDEATRFKSALAMAQTMGASADVLLKSAQHYMQILNQEESKFEQALLNQRTVQIKEKEEKAKRLQQVIIEKTQQIEKLNAEITSHREEMNVIQGELDQTKQKLENTKGDFLATYQTLIGQIKADIEKMNLYLK